MNWKLLNQPLGLSSFGGHDPAKKHIWPAIIMAAASIGSSIYGAAKSNQANAEAQARLDAERAINAAERRRKINENYIDTAAGQNMIRIARDEANKIYKQAEGAAAVAGGTEASKQMAKDAGNKMMGDAIANIAANDTARKDNLDASYRATDRQLAQQQIALDQQKGQNIANAASQIGSSLMNAAASYMGTKIGAGSPGGGGVTASTGKLAGGGGVTASTGKLANMGGGSFNFKSYANNYIKNMFGQSRLLPNKNPLTMNPMKFFNIGK